ncbi:MAG: transposase, partial [Chitinophagales bacterium]
MYKFFIGVDVSKSWIDVAYRVTGKTNYLGRFPNSKEGFEQMVDGLGKHTGQAPSVWFVCLENTGSYSKPLCRWLWGRNIPYREEMPLRISKSMGLSRGKSDKYDAKDICTYAYQRRDEIQADVPDNGDCTKLRKLLSRRAFLVSKKKATINSLANHKPDLDADTYALFKQHNEQLVELLSRQIAEIEERIKETVKQDKEIKENDQLGRSVIGVGPIISASIIAFSSNYSRFNNSREMASYLSIAPYPNQSGTSRKGKDKVHPFGNKFIKSLLSN